MSNFQLPSNLMVSESIPAAHSSAVVGKTSRYRLGLGLLGAVG